FVGTCYLFPASRAQEILCQNASDWHNQKNYGGQRDQGSSFHCKSQISVNETQSDPLCLSPNNYLLFSPNINC
ncbi:MAG: hypothetical protein ABSF48_21725, partial [Thermodesulfobacteriota bacterium]